MKKVEILDIEIDNLSQSELLDRLSEGGVVFTPNVDHIVKLQSDPLFREAYRFADYRVCDSQLLLWASKLIGCPIKEKVSGSDLFPAFYRRYSADEAVTIFLLGSSSGVAATAMQRINAKVGREIVVGAHSPSFQFLDNWEENNAIIRTINDSKATVLAIGVGAPKQEKWLLRHRDRLENIKVAMAIGATIDFEAGQTKRAPAWIGDLGLEWLYRLLREPKRLWKRYLVEDVVFFRLLARRYWLERIGKRKTKLPQSKVTEELAEDRPSKDKPSRSKPFRSKPSQNQSSQNQSSKDQPLQHQPLQHKLFKRKNARNFIESSKTARRSITVQNSGTQSASSQSNKEISNNLKDRKSREQRERNLRKSANSQY